MSSVYWRLCRLESMTCIILVCKSDV
jgi:hypothetical protein